MVFKLDENEQKKFDEWKVHIKELHGKYGDFEWIINYSGGIGYTLKVYSELAKVTLYLTDVDKW